MSIRLIPKVIKAKTELEAMKLMLVYQAKNQRQCNIINIYENKKGEICIWFYDEAKLNEFKR